MLLYTLLVVLSYPNCMGKKFVSKIKEKAHYLFNEHFILIGILFVTFGVFISNMALTKHPDLRNRQPISRNRGNLSDRLLDDNDGFDDDEDDDEDTTSVYFKVSFCVD